MTDNETIKALECCCGRKKCGRECPLYYTTDTYSQCSQKILKNTLDLINRQKAEIERLSKKNEELAEVLSDTIRIRYKEAKAEAYKECIEKVKEEYEDLMEFGYADISVAGLFRKLDNLLKEMVGEANDR